MSEAGFVHALFGYVVGLGVGFVAAGFFLTARGD